MRGDQPQSVDLYNNDNNNNGCMSKDNAEMKEKQPLKRYCEESLDILNAQSIMKRRLAECSTRHLNTESCPVVTDSKGKLN